MVRPGPGPMPQGSVPEVQAMPEALRSEYRAALLSVFTHTQRGSAEAARLLPSSMRPMPLREALRSISRASPSPDSKAASVASRRLVSTAASTPDTSLRRELRGYSRALLGEAQEEHLWRHVNQKRHLDAPLSAPELGAARTPGFTLEAPTASEEVLMGQVAALARRGSDNLPTRQELLPLLQAVDEQEEALSSAYLNMNSLVTTVTVATSSQLDFKDIAWMSDPRTWSLRSPFWRASTQVALQDGRFQPIQGPELGQSWRGNLYEFAEWNWNAASISAVQNYLNIDFRQHRWTEDGDELGLVWMGYSLFSCQGSMMLTRLAANGVDVDRGFLAVLYHHSKHEERPRSVALAQKNVRFCDILTRRTSQQGMAGAGQTMCYLAPAVVGLWMYEGFHEIFASKGLVNTVQSTAPTLEAELRRA
ncbi:hypothetical protein [Archangium sp.]|uniref:hypothetical protein n=1 Tax=Archangium sp. TaxID=1872627 RepID=UPI00286ACE5C|nr:hypothetical protein [Archangium sp.]